MKKVLVADDDRAILTTLTALLEMEGCEVRTSSSATEAELALRESAYDLVITDMRMETPTAGFDVVREARRQDAHAPVVILTAYPIPASDWRAEGATTLIVKGTSPALLVSEIRALLARPKPVKGDANPQRKLTENAS